MHFSFVMRLFYFALLLFFLLFVARKEIRNAVRTGFSFLSSYAKIIAYYCCLCCSSLVAVVIYCHLVF